MASLLCSLHLQFSWRYFPRRNSPQYILRTSRHSCSKLAELITYFFASIGRWTICFEFYTTSITMLKHVVILASVLNGIFKLIAPASSRKMYLKPTPRLCICISRLRSVPPHHVSTFVNSRLFLSKTLFDLILVKILVLAGCFYQQIVSKTPSVRPPVRQSRNASLLDFSLFNSLSSFSILP